MKIFLKKTNEKKDIKYAFIALVISLFGIGLSFLNESSKNFITSHNYILFIILFIPVIVYFFDNYKIFLGGLKADDHKKEFKWNEINKYKDFYPFVVIIGNSGVGKTTLLDSMRYQDNKNERTQYIYSKIVNYKSKKYFFIDMKGEESIQISQALKKADCVIFLLDHNSSSKSKNTSENRINENNSLIKRLISTYDGKVKLPTLFVLNKHDLWFNNNDLESKYTESIREWSFHFSFDSACVYFSNKKRECIIKGGNEKIYSLDDILSFVENNTK